MLFMFRENLINGAISDIFTALLPQFMTAWRRTTTHASAFPHRTRKT